MEKAKKMYLKTFGCQMNDADSSKIKNLMSSMKIGTTDDPKDADIILLNTCSIRWKAEHKVYSMLGTFKDIKKSRPDIIIGVGGCVAQQEQDEMFRKVPHLDIVFGTHNVHRLPEMINRVKAERCKVEETDFFDRPEPLVYPAPEDDGVRAFVNIIRGCNNFCTYCIVPYVRGREASRSSIEIVDEVKALSDRGVKEITLLGQNVNSYGNDLSGDIDFPGLLRKVAAVDGITRLRFTTSHPKDLSDGLIEAFGEIGTLANHLHLPVQSGSDKVLAAMKRGYTAASYLKNVEKLRKVRPDIAISTDMIVGFPGEEDADFQKTLALMGEVVYDSAFYFKYSVRPGTAAAKFQDAVPEDIKSERLTALQALQKEHSITRNKAEEGKVQMVLVEGVGRKHGSFLTGRTSGNKVVNFDGPDGAVGQMVPVMIKESTANALKGEIHHLN
jgi:tRNA-2-methylthio-N6-dimethylallyladenosine synthase